MQQVLQTSGGTDACAACADVFSQVSDSRGVLVPSRFEAFLREALKLPTAVYEGPSFGYAHALTRPCFPQQVPVSRLRPVVITTLSSRVSEVLEFY